MNLKKLFEPKSIAIYGVSSNPEKIGSVIFFNLLSSEFEGKLFPINPKYKNLMGHKCYTNVSDIKEEIDLAIMAIPGELILDVLKDCYKKKIKMLVVISAGFSETGEKGKVLEDKAIELAKKYDIEMLGPNCLGLLVSRSKMNASFASSNIIEGDIALMAQSGAVCTAFIDAANSINLGFSHLISVGNKKMINEVDLMEHFLKDQNVKVVGVYIEEFKDGKKFIKLKDEIGVEKPVVVMSPGQSEAAQSAMQSHTGALASSHKVVQTALNKYGIITTDKLSQLFAMLQGFERVNTLPKGKKVAIVTNAGGMGILATDALVSSGLELAQFSEKTINKLSKKLPAASHVKNPIDVIGDAKADRYEYCLDILANAEEVDSIFLILSPQLVTEIEDTAKLISNVSKKIQKPIIPVFLGGEYVDAGLKRLNNNNILCFSDLDLAVYTLDKITEYAEYVQNKSLELGGWKNESRSTNMNSKSRLNLEKYINDQSSALPEEIVQQMLIEFKFDTPKTMLVDSVNEALLAAEKIGYPIVIKATTEDIAHKTDVEAIFLGINNEKELVLKSKRLFENILSVTKRSTASFILQEQLKYDLELFLGVKRDDNFGYVILFGSGGIYTEVYQDISQSLIPLDLKDIENLIDSTKVSKIINGVRGKGRLAKDELIEAINKLQKMLKAYPEIYEIDVNPAMLTKDRCILADVKVYVKAPKA